MTSDGLRIARGLTLPIDFVTKTTGILAQRRKGKTYTASVMAEELVRLRVPFVALDPTGAWWGLRSSADGDRPGLPVTIIGGQHGDLPLEPGGGAVIADLVVDHPGFYIVDFKLLESNAEERQVAAAFAERLYRRKARDDSPLHLFVDEADRFVPQRPPRGEERMLGAFEALVRRGGLRGIGTTLISQRAAVVNKNVLEQLDLLVALRIVGPNDQRAIAAYVRAHGSEEEQAELLGSLASLRVGEAWLWEPGEDLFTRALIRQRRTFNSSATPEVGAKVVEPRRMAPVDLEKAREAMAGAIERAKENDPAELRRQIAALTAQVRRLEERPVPEPQEVCPPLPLEQARRVEGAIAEANSALMTAAQAAAAAVKELEALDAAPSRLPPAAPRAPAPQPAPRPVPPAPDPAPVAAAASNGDRIPGGRPRAMLHALAHHPGGLTKRRLAAMTGTSTRKSTLRNALSELRTAGFIVSDGDLLRATQAGLDALGPVAPLPRGPALLDHWHREMGDGAEWRILCALIEAARHAPPGALSREEVAERARIDPTKSTLRNALSVLRVHGLLDSHGSRVAASTDLLEAIG